MSRARIAVHDAFWSTAGGGERYAGGVADVLSRDHDVTLLAPEPVDTAWLGERLALDLSRVAVEVVDPCDPLERTTAGYDLLVNLSYRDHGRNGARRGVYVVHFPDRPGGELASWQATLQRGGRKLLGPGALPIRIAGGFHRPDVIRWQEVRWTNGRGVLEVLPLPRASTLHLWFGRFVPGGATRTITVSLDGEPVAEAVLAPPPLPRRGGRAPPPRRADRPGRWNRRRAQRHVRRPRRPRQR